MKKAVASKVRKAPKASAKRDLNAELLAVIGDEKAGQWARKTEFTRRADGGWRRRIVLADGSVEKDEIIPASASAQIARAGTGLSQAQFAKLIGVSLCAPCKSGSRAASGLPALRRRCCGSWRANRRWWRC